MFKLQNVRYKNIVDIESLIIPSQKVTCIIGESGSGKTTLLRLLNNLISCEEGTIYYKNTNIETLDPVKLRREVVMLPQTPVIYPGTVKDNLLVAIRFAGTDSVEEKSLNNIMEKTRLKINLDGETSNLSGGEKQRLALCRILLMEPDALLLDEPTSALDDDTSDTIIQLLKDFVIKRNKTVLMVTHSKSFAEKYGDLVIKLDNGKIINREMTENTYG